MERKSNLTMEEKNKRRINLETISHQEERIIRLLRQEQKQARDKFPLVYALVATFGLVAIASGFSKLTERIGFFEENPDILLLVGIIILIITGAVYRKTN